MPGDVKAPREVENGEPESTIAVGRGRIPWKQWEDFAMYVVLLRIATYSRLLNAEFMYDNGVIRQLDEACIA